jgi:uncharacterized glyoxalase superfamily protein PhnB/uncharacterized protein YciI
MPTCTVIPELAYPDVGEAVAWLRDVFGFTLRLGIGNHRAQLNVGDGAVVVTERGGRRGQARETVHSVLVRVGDVDGHHTRASERGARILRLPADYPYGERQYTAQDFAGHCWTFSQSVADVAPEEWGGTPGDLSPGATDKRVDSGRGQLFAVIRTRGPRWQPSRPMESQAEWSAHAAFMDALAEEGVVILGGPLEATPDALVVVRADSAAEVRSRLSADPWTAMDLLRDTLVAPWTLRLGSLDVAAR